MIEGNASIVGTTSAGVCPTGKVITGFSTGSSTYGLPICGTSTSPQYWSSTDAGVNIYFTGAGNVGIGTATPGARLDVAGQLKITGGTPGAGKILTSDAAGLASWLTLGVGCDGGGRYNTCYGSGALSSNVSGMQHTANGYMALNQNISGHANTANGYMALSNNTTG